MSDFTVFDVAYPPEAKQRVIVNTDAKNEADDQFAIVHAVLTPSFDLRGIIPAHFGTHKSATSMQDSHDETMLLLRLMGLEGEVRVEDGAAHAIPDESTPADSPGARLIIEEAMKDDKRPLHVAFYGPLTDMASALLLEPKIQDRGVIFRAIMVQVFSPKLGHPFSPKRVHQFSPKVVHSFSPKLVQGDNGETPSLEAYFPFWNQQDREGVCQARGRRPWIFERC